MKRKSDSAAAKSDSKKAKQFDKETVEASGFCTNADLVLSADLVQTVLSESASDNEERHQVVVEKDLLGTGRSKKELHILNDDEPHKKIVFYYSGKRFAKKDKEHTMSFLEAVREAKPELADAQAFVLLATESEICKRNALRQLVEAGVVVQRV